MFTLADSDADNMFAQANPIKALELNIDWVFSVVLPALQHPIQAIRDSLQLALSYCRRPHVCQAVCEIQRESVCVC
jgi:hypothetical protein